MIEELFDGAAGAYDRTGPSVFTEFGARLVEQMPFEAGARVLDVATGTGAVLLPAAHRSSPPPTLYPCAAVEPLCARP
jgi:ubiquinone/menaquinone biosynthesis C-methylase UbiE